MHLSSKLSATTTSIPVNVLEILDELRTLDLSNNFLAGPIPSEIDSLRRLENLDLSSNKFSGEIPETLGNIVNLTVLDLSGNQLSGEVPASMTNLLRLREVYLNGNQLEGIIPQFHNVSVLEIGDNNGLREIGEETSVPENNELTSDTEGIDISIVVGITAAVLVVLTLISLVLYQKLRNRGTKYKHIKLIKKIDKGGFGEVWEGTFKGNTVAVKLILKTNVNEKNKMSIVEMLTVEAQNMQQLKHDRIGSIFTTSFLIYPHSPIRRF